jgi:hypothetical protein
MFISVYHGFIACYEFLKYYDAGIYSNNYDNSVICFLNASNICENLENKYSPTTNLSVWFDWEASVMKAIKVCICPFVCEEKITLEQGLECVRIFLKDRYLLDKKDASLKIVFEELQFIIDPVAVLNRKFRQSCKLLDMIKKSWLWSFSRFKKNRTVIEPTAIQLKHDINFEYTEIWKFWLTCIEKSKKFNKSFQYNKKKISIKQCFMACYEYIRAGSNYDKPNFSVNKWEVRDLLILTEIEDKSLSFPTNDITYYCWYDWMDLVQEVIEKYDVKFATDSEEGLSLEQGLEAMRIFVEKYYYNKNNDILLIDVLKDMDRQINNNLETTEMWKYWIECFKEAKKFDKIFYKESVVEVV